MERAVFSRSSRSGSGLARYIARFILLASNLQLLIPTKASLAFSGSSNE